MKFSVKTIMVAVLGVSAFLLGILGFLKANHGYSVATAMLASLQRIRAVNPMVPTPA